MTFAASPFGLTNVLATLESMLRRKIFLSKQKNKQTYSKSLACVTIDFSVDGKVVVKLFFRATITIFFPNKTRKPIASYILLSGKKKRSYNLNDLGLPSPTEPSYPQNRNNREENRKNWMATGHHQGRRHLDRCF